RARFTKTNALRGDFPAYASMALHADPGGSRHLRDEPFIETATLSGTYCWVPTGLRGPLDQLTSTKRSSNSDAKVAAPPWPPSPAYGDPFLPFKARRCSCATTAPSWAQSAAAA